MMRDKAVFNGASLGMAAAALALLGGAASDAGRAYIKATPALKKAMQGVSNDRRAKVKAARRQNVRRLIEAKYA
jgi:hypothetical protein